MANFLDLLENEERDSCLQILFKSIVERIIPSSGNLELEVVINNGKQKISTEKKINYMSQF